MRLRSQISTLMAILGLGVASACSPLEIVERDDEDEIAYPQAISGAYLASYDNSRARCTYTKDENSACLYRSQCNVVVHVSGKELNANLIAKDTKVKWGTPQVSSGQALVKDCRTNDTGLVQFCCIEPVSSSAKIDFGFDVSFKEKKRKEVTRLLLPYSVEVAAGFVPNLASFQVEAPKPTQHGKYQEEKNGFQVVEFSQDKIDLLFENPPVCATSMGMYFYLSGSLFRLKDEMVRHVAGSQYDLDNNHSLDGLRYKFDKVHKLACNSTEVYIRENNRILALNHLTSKLRVVVDNLKVSPYQNFLSVTEDGLLYYDRDLNLVEFNTISQKEIIFISSMMRNIAVPLSDAEVVSDGMDFAKSDDGSYLLEVAQYRGNFFNGDWIYKTHGDKKVHIPYPVEAIDTLLGDDGKVYSLSNANRELKLVVSNGNPLDDVIIDLSWTSTRTNDFSEIPIKLLTVDRKGKLYLYDPVRALVVSLKASENYQFQEPIVASDKSSRFKRLLPMNPYFDTKGHITFFDGTSQTFNVIKEEEIIPSRVAVNNKVCPAFNAYAIAPNGAKASSCYQSIYIDHPQLAESITIGGNYGGMETPTAGFIEEEIRTGFPRGLFYDKNSVLYYSDLNRIHKLENNKIEVVAGQPDTDEYGEEMGGFRDGLASEARLNEPYGIAVAANGDIFFADSQNHRIRRIFKGKDGKFYVDTVVGSGEKGFGGDGGPALQAKLACPSDVTMTSEGTLYFVDGMCHRGDLANHFIREDYEYSVTQTFAGDRIRKVEWVQKDGKREAVISTFFGGATNQECGAGKINDKAKQNSLSDELKSSLSMFCHGFVTGVRAKDNCSAADGYVDLAITQGFYKGYGNLVHVRQPCQSRPKP